MNARLAAVACPAQALCFAVGQAVPFGAGNDPGTALVERWNGRRWSLVKMPATRAPLTSISCTSPRACTAVGGFEHAVGTPAANNQRVIYTSVIARWDGRRWSAQSPPVPAGAAGDVLNGVSCTSSASCTAVGTAPAPPPGLPGSVPIDQALILTSTGTGWTAQTLPYPGGTTRQPASEPPSSELAAVACQTFVSCAAVGDWGATNGDIGPLAAFWNGTSWAQTVIRRGPVQLRSVACPALGWCLAVGGTMSDQFIG